MTAVNQAQAEAVELGMTDSIFPLEECSTPIAWVDCKRQLANMIISYSGEAVQRGRGRLSCCSCVWRACKSGRESLQVPFAASMVASKREWVAD